jgi:DNA-binding NarL/FixJ family response regulator
MTVRVVIVDDEPLVRAGLRMVLSTEPGIEVVGEAGDGAEGVEAARRLHPDVVLMDLHMPRLDGVQATRLLRDGSAQAPRVVVVTTFAEDSQVIDALRAGASGYVLKDAPEQSLVAAIKGSADGAAVLDHRLIGRLLRLVAPRPGCSSPQLSALTPREVDVLRLLAEGMSNGQIGKRLLIGEATVKTHVARVLDKLGLEGRAQAVVVAYESGLVRPGES